MAKPWDCVWPEKYPTLDLPTSSTWVDLSICAVEADVIRYEQAYNGLPTTIIFSTADIEVACQIRYCSEVGKRLTFWVPVPGVRPGMYVLGGEKGYVCSPGS